MNSESVNWRIIEPKNKPKTKKRYKINLFSKNKFMMIFF